MEKKSAILLGATGLTGGLLLQKLLKDSSFEKIILFSRSSVNIQHPKLEEHLIDLFQLEKHKEKFNASVVYCCIGTTQKKTPDNETYRTIDYGIPATAAKLAKQNGINKMIVVSALGADKESRFFYNKTKGEMEEAVLQQGIEETYVLRPSLIAGNREESRPFEYAWKQVMKVGNLLMFGPLKKYRSIQAATIAKAMQLLGKQNYQKSIIESEEIKQVAKDN